MSCATYQAFKPCAVFLQVRVGEYNQLKAQVGAMNRKQTGNLAVRDLAGLVHKDNVVATENLVTVFVVVPKQSRAEWLTSYEQLSDFVVCPAILLTVGRLK